MECAEQPMERPRTNGDDVLKAEGQAAINELPKLAPMHPVMRMDATANFGSHSGPMALEPSIPNADITERFTNGNDNGDGTDNGDGAQTAPIAVASNEKEADALHVANAQRK